MFTVHQFLCSTTLRKVILETNIKLAMTGRHLVFEGDKRVKIYISGVECLVNKNYLSEPLDHRGPFRCRK
jgi:hypothetical protein